MRFLFVNDFHVPQLLRGTEVNTHALCTSLKALGHEPSVVCALIPTGFLGLHSRVRLKANPRKAWVADGAAGYPTYRSWHVAQTLAEVAAYARPDVLVIQTGNQHVAQAAAMLGLPTLHYLHFIPEWASLPPLRNGSYLTNSVFCQRSVESLYGVRSAVIRPIVLPGDYRTTIVREEVTAFSMLLDKGADIVLELARRNPGIGFRVYSNQRALHERDRPLFEQASTLPNVTIAKPKKSGRAIYRRTRMVLAPSRWQETWGRMSTEAHVNDIPVLASDRGGLPESVGTGGRCLSPEAPIDAWNEALTDMFGNEASFAAYQRGARQQHLSPLIDPASICQEFIRQANMLATVQDYRSDESSMASSLTLSAAGDLNTGIP